MDKLKNAGNAIKKKLSLQDYQTTEQHDSIPSNEQAAIPAQQFAGTSVEQHVDMPASQQDVSPAHQHANKPAEQHVSIPVSQHTNKVAHQQDDLSVEALAKSDMLASSPDGKSVKKIKVTHYLSEEDNDRLTNMYIKRLQEKKKVDKSALISQAIQLLFKKENK